MPAEPATEPDRITGRSAPRGVIVAPRYYLELAVIAGVVAAAVGLRSGMAVAAQAGVIAIGALVLSVGCHEGAHAAAARWAGVPVHALRLRGAMTASIVRGTVRPGRTAVRDEVVICLAGPAASLVLLTVAAAVLVVGPTGPAAPAAWCLLGANLIAVVGSLPGLPGTDGTRARQVWRRRAASRAHPPG